MTNKHFIKAEYGANISLLINTVPSAKALVIFAHGAGANMSHEFMDELTELFNLSSINVLRFNFPYMDKRQSTGKKYPPDRMPKLLDCYTKVVEYAIAYNGLDNLPVFIGGKSMGSRVAVTLLANEQVQHSAALKLIRGVFCLGYPFHPAKKPEKLRLEPLLETSKKVIIVQGERDTLGNQEEVIGYKLPEHCEYIFLADGDHSLKPRVKSGFSYNDHKQQAVDEIVKFIDSL